MNLVMPKMDGTTATRVLRDSEVKEGLRRLPIIGIIATASDEEVCIAAGMDDCIEKPIVEAELLKVVDTYIAHDDHRTNLESGPRNAILDWALKTSLGSGTIVEDSLYNTLSEETPAAFRVLLAVGPDR